MNLLLYNFAIRVFVIAIHLAALFHPKAQRWVKGRQDWRTSLKSKISRLSSSAHGQKPKILWIHAASLGEFEQGRPVLETFRERFPEWKIVLTFFSPSGYEIRKDYPHADLVCYLPADTRQNARDFLELLAPQTAIFVKYEFWANYLFELKKRGVPTLIVSALFRPSQPFFKWYGGFWRQMLGSFTHFFVQNESSGSLLQSIGFQNVTVAGDTRVDRVLNIAAETRENAVVEAFTRDWTGPILIVGSSWAPDEDLIFEALPATEEFKLIIAPHEPSESNVQRICTLAGNAVRYSRWPEVTSPRNEEVSPPPPPREVSPPPQALVIDNIGLLNTLYRYGSMAYIGGGFGKGIHNTLEPAAFGLPILFGPKYQKFEEARQFVARGGAFLVHNAADLKTALLKLQDPVFYEKASRAVRTYLEESRGGTDKIMDYIMDNQLG